MLRKNWLIIVIGLVFTIVFFSEPTLAVTVLNLNGSPMPIALSQGDSLTWQYDCAVGATTKNAIYIDLDNDNVIDPTDKVLYKFCQTDGDTLGAWGPPDLDWTKNGSVTFTFKCSFAPGRTIMKVIEDTTSVQNSVLVNPLPSPAATITGHIYVPDTTKEVNLSVVATSDGGGPGWMALTDSLGNYTINMDTADAQMDSTWRVGPDDEVWGYAKPLTQLIPVGVDTHKTNVNFSYTSPIASIKGTVKDNLGASLSVDPQLTAGSEVGYKYMTITPADSYGFFFGSADTGYWSIRVDEMGWDLMPNYLVPWRDNFRVVSGGDSIYNFVCYIANNLIQGTVTKDGVPSGQAYLMDTWCDSLRSWSMSLSNATTGAYSLPTSSLGGRTYMVEVSHDDAAHPFPPGYVIEGGPRYNVPPDSNSVNLNLVPANYIRGTISQDLGDAQPVTFTEIYVVAMLPGNWNWVAWTSDSANGNYALPVWRDTFNVNCYYTPDWERFLFYPMRIDSIITTGGDVSGQNFIVNYAHCLVQVTLNGNPSGPGYSLWTQSSGTYPDCYGVWKQVDGPGTYNVYICNATGWVIYPPNYSGYNVSPSSVSLGDISHSDVFRTATFNYTTGVEETPDRSQKPLVTALAQNCPNPFNQLSVIRYQLSVEGRVSLKIYNVAGQLVKTLVDEKQDAGYFNIRWDGKDESGKQAAAGVYFYRLEAGNFTSTKKMILMR